MKIEVTNEVNFRNLKNQPINGGIQYLARYNNGYGASVVLHDFSYGNKKGLWELAVIQWHNDEDFNICYDTVITNGVLGYLTESDVNELLERIIKL